VDATLGRLLADLQASRVLDRTLIVIARAITARPWRSRRTHPRRLHLRGHASRAAHRHASRRAVERTVEQDVQLIDVAPTILDLLAVAAPSMEGRSLLPAINARPMTDVPTYFEALDANRTRNWGAARRRR
jgi:arylsulfatase A-like enzyme